MEHMARMSIGNTRTLALSGRRLQIRARISIAEILGSYNATRISPLMSTQKPSLGPHEPLDPIPNPDPASPSLDEPDPGVFHHDPAKPPSSEPYPDSR